VQVNECRRQLEVRVSGYDVPKPIQTFGQAGFDHLLLGAVKRAGYDKPTAIQAQAMPAVLSGRDVLVGGIHSFTKTLILKPNA
jgi:superfamily II DNA/RNA helicase